LRLNRLRVNIIPVGVPELESMPLPRLLAIAGALMSARWTARVAESGVEAAELALLYELMRQDGLSHREAAERCWISPAKVTGTVDALEASGRVERRRTTEDRRVVRVYLTDAGREIVERTYPRLHEDMAPLADLLAGDDEPVVRRFLVETIRRLHPGGTS
jgi:DNA-binding MarR family transcriptional regulator